MNDSQNYEKKDKALVDNLKHHRSDLCEACQKGCCELSAPSRSRQNPDYDNYSSGRYKK